MYFPSYGLQKTWIDKCLKSPVLQDLSRGNLVNKPEHRFSINGSTFTLFIDQCEGN